jgi:predicted dehydrogenase
MSDLRRALIIGCGRIASDLNNGPDDRDVLSHALAYTRHKSHVLAACVEPDANAREAFIKKWNVPRGYATLEEALAAERFSAASVCSPTGTHLAILAQLEKSDIAAVFAEKPLDGDAKSARRIGEQFAAKNIPVAVNFTRRFDRTMHALRSEIAAKHYGALRSVTGSYGRGVVNNGSHQIDLIIFLAGRAPKIVCVGGPVIREIEGDPTVSAILDLDGVPVHLVAGGGARFETELAFEHAVVTIEENGLWLRTRRIASSRLGALLPQRGEWMATEYGTAMLSALDELAAWKPGMRLSSDIESGCESIELADKLRKLAMESRA